jgi:dTDP-4-amino-4,6-dideoxygalactose transaminase
VRCKDSLETLAILGGAPAFAEPLHVGRPGVAGRERFLARVADILDRRWLTNGGPYVQALEERLAAFLGVRHCVAVCNATVGLEIAARAAGLAGEVIVPSMTFVATAHALHWQGIAPVFCDVDPVAYTLDPARVEAAVTPRTTGLIGVHLWGRPCDVEALEAIARRRRLTVLYDASHALGCTRRGVPIGGFGAAEVFSFHATKFVQGFEGGAVATNDDALAARVRLMKNFGFAGYDQVVFPGTNGKMTEICAAMALTSLESAGESVAVNRRHYERYRRELAGLPGLRLLTYDETERGNYQYLVIEVDAAALGLSRDALLAVLHAEGVLARRYFWPGCHRMEPYRTLAPDAGRALPVTERALARVLTLPTGRAVDAEAIAGVCAVIRLAAAHGPELAARLARRAGDAAAASPVAAAAAAAAP